MDLRGLTDRVTSALCLVSFGHQTYGLSNGEKGEVFPFSVQLVQASKSAT